MQLACGETSTLTMDQAIEMMARKRYPDPLTGSHKDKDDYSWRQTKAELQQKAYIQGRIDEKNEQLNLKPKITGK